MSKTNVHEDEYLAHILQNAAIANIGDAAGLPAAAVAGSLEVSLHTADPGEAGDQSTSEAAYTSYARQVIVRAAGANDWDVAAGVGSNKAMITFPVATAPAAETETHFGVGTGFANKLLYSGLLTSPPGGLPVSVGIQPEFAIGALTLTED